MVHGKLFGKDRKILPKMAETRVCVCVWGSRLIASGRFRVHPRCVGAEEGIWEIIRIKTKMP